MQAYKEITGGAYPGHIYLIEGARALAYIPQGSDTPRYFQHSLKFDRRGRRFERASIKLFPQRVATPSLTQVVGSRGNVYWVNATEHTCTCPGFRFRGHCRHVEAA